MRKFRSTFTLRRHCNFGPWCARIKLDLCYVRRPKPEWHHNYNQATTTLTFRTNETSKDLLSIIYNWLSVIVIYDSGARQTTQKLAHCYMRIILIHKKDS